MPLCGARVSGSQASWLVTIGRAIDWLVPGELVCHQIWDGPACGRSWAGALAHSWQVALVLRLVGELALVAGGKEYVGGQASGDGEHTTMRIGSTRSVLSTAQPSCTRARAGTIGVSGGDDDREWSWPWGNEGSCTWLG